MAQKTRVLIADDHQDSAEVLGVLLRLAGCDVCVVHSGPDAIEAAPEFKPQLVILDISMPGMDGHKTAAALKKQSWSKGAIYVAHTAYGDARSLKRIKDSGFQQYVTKPGTIAQFEAILDSMRQRG